MIESTDLIGTVLSGRFRVIDHLGEGAAGTVYLAEHQDLGRKYAIKVIRSRYKSNQKVVERFRREARVASRLDHPNIVYITDFGQMDDGRFYLVMEFLPGKTLRQVMEQGLLPLPRALELLRQLASALAAAHDAGVIHRDLKPDNMVLNPGHGGREQLKVLDFGLAKIIADAGEPAITKEGDIFGTPDYMSPEQVIGAAVDPRTDIYALGVLAFEILAGQLPFECESLPEVLSAHREQIPPAPSTLRPDTEAPLPRRVEETILQCLEKKPDHRPPNVREVEQVLKQALEDLWNPPAEPELSLEPLSEEQIMDLWQTIPRSRDGARAPSQMLGDTMRRRPADPSAMGEGSDWFWSRITTKARELAQLLRDRRLGSVEMTQILGGLWEQEESALAAETEVALLEARLDDLDTLTREREARLRYAVVDLSLERSRLLDEGLLEAPTLIDLGYQISELERRIHEVQQEKTRKQQLVEAELEQKQREHTAFQQQLTDLQLRLLQLLQAARPTTGPADVLASYEELAELLRRMS